MGVFSPLAFSFISSLKVFLYEIFSDYAMSITQPTPSPLNKQAFEEPRLLSGVEYSCDLLVMPMGSRKSKGLARIELPITPISS